MATKDFYLCAQLSLHPALTSSKSTNNSKVSIYKEQKTKAELGSLQGRGRGSQGEDGTVRWGGITRPRCFQCL